MSSSCHSLRAVLAPRPGRRTISTRLSGTRPRSFSSAAIVPVSRSSPTFVAIVSPMSSSSVSRPCSDSAPDRLGRLAEALRGPAVGEHAVDDGAVQLVEVAEQVEEIGDLGVAQGHGRIVAAAAWRPFTARMGAVTASARFLVCVPTYDERENLERMVDALDGVREPDGATGDVLVIDDSSPDGTGELADELAATRPWLHVLHRPPKQGLGRAYLDGFRWALARDYDYVLEMDCDFSHDPPPSPRCSRPRAPAPTSCSARATARAAASRTGAARGASSRAPAASMRARCSACACAT